MTSDSYSVEDLMARARRGSLSDDEQRALREALSTSAGDRFLFEAGCEFDSEAPVLARDDETIERMARVARKHSPKRRRKTPTSGLAAAAAIGMLFGATTVAAFQLARSMLAGGSVGTPAGSADSPSRAPPRTVARAGVPSAPSVLPALPDPTPLETPPRNAQPAPPAPAPGYVAPEPEPVLVETAANAAALFAEASRARVRGDTSKAIILYERLESEFSQSPEASNARLSLGMLYQQSGRVELALTQFRAYRKQDSGAAMPEALWGEAQALEKLGRLAEQQKVLEELLRRYPDSAYASAARKHLAAIDRGAH